MDDVAREIGELLRNTRLGLGISLHDASGNTKIRERYLRALEDADFKALPSDEVYSVGFLLSYANFLGLDGADIVKSFKDEVGKTLPSVEDDKYDSSCDYRASPSWVILAISVILLASYMAIFHSRGQDTFESLFHKFANKYIQHRHSLSPYLQDKGGDYVASQERNPIKDKELIIIAKDKTVVKVLDSRYQLLSTKALNKGEIYFVNDTGEDLTVVADNPDMIEVLDSDQIDKF
jgi:hypothetical protein